MDNNKTIEGTLEVMRHLPVEEQKAVNEFAGKVLARIEDKMLIEGMMKLQEQSPRTFEFLDDGEIYTEQGAIARYEN